MRVVSCVALIGAASAKPIELEILENDLGDIEFTTTTVPTTESETVTKKTEQRKPIMPTLPPSYKPMFSDNPEFRSFAVKNNFPPVVEERQMMAQFNQHRNKLPQQNPFMVREEPKSLTCMECSGNTYEECYLNARERTCPQQETSCFLEVRYRGEAVVSVQSGCMQEIACINNMKQNFYDFNEYGQGGVNKLDTGRHDCKLHSGNPFANSVCRNCCFSDNCTDGWQPQSFEDWNIADRKEVKRQMQLFDQFVYAPNHWDNIKQQRQHLNQRGSIQYVNSLAELNRPPTMADLNRNNPKIVRAPVVATKSPRDHVASFRAKQLAAQRKRQEEQLQRQRIQSFRKPTVVKTTQKTTTKATPKPTTRRPWQRRTPKVTTTKRTTITTAKPTTTTSAVNDEDFMALIAMLEASDKAEEKAPTAVEKKPTKSKLAKKKTQKPPKPVQLKSAVKVVKTTTQAPTTTTKKVTTTEAPTTVKATTKKPVRKGPWSHLPPWKQRQLQAARQKAIAQAKAKKAAALAKQKQAQPQMMKFSSSVAAPGTKLEDGPIVEVSSSLSDEDFGKLIASMDAKDDDLDAIVKVMEAENAEEVASSEESDH